MAWSGTAANVAGLVVNIELISTIVLAVYILGERLSSRRVLGGGVTLAGVLIVTADGLRLSDLTGSSRMLGNVLVMLAGIAWSVFAVAQRRAQIGGGLFQRLTPIFSVATLVMFPFCCALFLYLRSSSLIYSSTNDSLFNHSSAEPLSSVALQSLPRKRGGQRPLSSHWAPQIWQKRPTREGSSAEHNIGELFPPDQVHNVQNVRLQIHIAR